MTLTICSPFGKDGQAGRVSGRPALSPDVAHRRRRRNVSHLNRKLKLKPNRISNHYNMLNMLMSSVICYVTA